MQKPTEQSRFLIPTLTYLNELHVHATVYLDNLSGYIRRHVRSQEQSNVGNIFRSSATTQRNLLCPFSLHFVRQFCCHIGDNNPGAIALARIPREPSSCAIDLARPIHTSFGCRVVTLTCIAMYTYNRSHVDDASALLTHHDRSTSMNEVEC